MSPFVRPPIIRLGDRLSARSVLLVLLGIFTATLSGLPEDLASELDFQTTRSLARGSYVLSDTPEARAIIGQRVDVLQAGPGEWVADRPIGAPLVGVPLYWLGTLLSPLFDELEARHGSSDVVPRSEYVAHLFVGWRNAVAAALTAWLLVLSARRVGATRRNAWLAGLAFGLTTLVWAQARAWSPSVPAMFFLFAAFHLLLRMRERFERLLRPTRLVLFAMGASLAMVVLTVPALAPAALVVAVALVLTILAGYRRLAQFALFLRKTWRFGHWVDLGWTALPVGLAAGLALGGPTSWTELVPPPSEDLLGDVVLLFVSPGRGFLWVAPLLLFAPLGWARALGRGARLWPAAALSVALLVVYAAHPPIPADEAWGYGPGRVLPLLPAAWLGVALALDQVERVVVLRRLAWTLCTLGLVANLPGVLVDAATYQDLVTQSPPGEGGVRRRDEGLYRIAAWDGRLAQPWAHWRILRHRMAGLGESFPPDEIFFLEPEEPLEPHRERDRGFGHVAWIDLRDRLGARPDPPVLLALVLLGAGCVTALRGLDRALP